MNLYEATLQPREIAYDEVAIAKLKELPKTSYNTCSNCFSINTDKGYCNNCSSKVIIYDKS